jgi:soluble lytic murein transglycosylase
VNHIIRLALFISILTLALAACGGKGQPTAPPTAPAGPTLVPTFTAVARVTASPAQPTATLSPTPDGLNRLTATLTATPTPTSTPTATPLPSARLETGRYLQAIGDCDGARREFAGVVADDPNPDEVAEARYRLASCYLRDDAPSEAAGALAQLLASAPLTATHRAPATFLLGEALIALNRWPEAELSFVAYLPLVPELNSLTWQRIGAARRGAGDLPRATEAFSAALKTAPDWANTVTIRRTLADLALAQKDYAGAVAQYDALRGSSTSGAWNAEMHWLAGAALAQGDAATNPPAEARKRWQAAVDAAPTSPYAHRAMAALVEAGAAVDEYQRGLVNYFNGRFALASAAFDRLRATDPTGRKGDAWYYAGLSYLRQGQIERGLAELGNLIAAYPENSHWADAWLAQASGRAQAKDLAAAIATSRQFAGQRPDDRQAPTALWRAANWQAEMGDLAAAADAYRALARKYPAADEAWRAYQAAGLIYFQRGDWPAAAETWGEMAAAPLEPFTTPLAYFWLGRAQAAAGDMVAARQAWQEAVQADARSYYGLRAAAWLAKSANQPISTTPAAGAQLATAGADDRGELVLWLKSWTGEGSVALPAAVTADADWRRGQALFDLGRRTQGLAAWARVLDRHAGDGWASAALALAFRDAGANQFSITAAEKLAALAPANSPAPPAALGRLIYPLPYARLIQQEADRWDLDPLLLAAVIRQESRFEPAATSSASAQGLMQLMPATAEWIAGQQGRGSFKPEQAYWSYINVDFGAYYLNWALKQLDGSLAAALAGYNGGPGNALRWRKLAPGDDDLMVALIDYGETRVYVQQVLGQLEAYRRLYALGH